MQKAQNLKHQLMAQEVQTNKDLTSKEKLINRAHMEL